jgi:sigma-B regulation protein RsbQ
MNIQVSNKPAVIHHDLQLHYSLSGFGEITLLFVHGLFLDETYWEAQIDYFSSSYQVITIDLAGHGKSGNNRSTWTIEQFGHDVIALLKRLQLKQVILIGHSIGAKAILEAAILYPQPIIGVIAVEAFKNAGTSFAEEFKEDIQGIEDQLNANFSATSEGYAQKNLLHIDTPTIITERISKAYREGYEEMGIGIFKDVLAYTEREREFLQQLPFKLYLINVNNQPTNTDALDHYTSIPCELLEMKGSSHFPMIENPKEMNELLGVAITSITRTRNNDDIPQFIE